MFNLIKAGGITMIPLLILAVIALAIIIDKIIFYHKLVRIPQEITNIIEKYNFEWDLLINILNKLSTENCYRRFFSIIIDIKQKKETIPLWWLESRTNDEAKIAKIEQYAVIVSGTPDFLCGVYHSYLLEKLLKNNKHINFATGSHYLLLEWPECLARELVLFFRRENKSY